MSTKATIMHSREDDWHFYDEYADGQIHLQVKGKEVMLPYSFKEMVKTAIEMHQMKEMYNRDEKKFFSHSWDKCTDNDAIRTKEEKK